MLKRVNENRCPKGKTNIGGQKEKGIIAIQVQVQQQAINRPRAKRRIQEEK